jgi:YVTN family beta-propeller protein
MRPLLLLLAIPMLAADYAAPAGIRPALRRPGAASILPGGRIISPLGRQFVTGPGPFGLAISGSGKMLVSANSGPDRFSLTVLEQDRTGAWSARQLVAPRKKKSENEGLHSEKGEEPWHSLFVGLAFATEHTVYASEGNSGRVRLVDLTTGAAKKIYDLNQEGFADSFTGDLAFDAGRGVVYVLDTANFRLAAIDVKKQRVLSSLRLGRLPFALALSPDKRRAYVTNIGMFDYKPVPGVDVHSLRETGLPFPAFGFPSPESRDGVRRETAKGPVEVPGLGDPNVQEANSLAVIDLADPAAPKVQAFIRTGLPFGEGADGGSSPSGVVATADRVFVSNGHNDSITVIDPKTNRVTGQIEIRIPGLEKFRGVLPIGMAYHESSGWLLVAEAGINAVGVIDTRQSKVLGHLPAAWFPSRVLVDDDEVYVTNVNGQGTGPNTERGMFQSMETFLGTFRRGSIESFPLPDAAAVTAQTQVSMDDNGFHARQEPPAAMPAGVKYVVLIVKENRTYDEVFGDIQRLANGSTVMGAPVLARFGRVGYAAGNRHRLSLQRIDVTPNHHAMALRWCFSDNFYADSEVSVDGHHWLVGAYPDAWTETSFRASYADGMDFRFPTSAPGRLHFAESSSSVHPEEQPEGGTIWHHLERHGVSFRNYGEGFELAGGDEGEGYKPTGARFVINVPMPEPLYRNTSRAYPMFNMNIPDQFRATQFIDEIQEKYVKGGEPFPRFIYIHLPNDHMAKPRPKDGYPFEASYVADNDYALGRIVEFLSQTPWWREMAIFVTEDDAQGGRDHIDAHRTVFMGIGPYWKRNYVSHVNTSFPGMLKTIFRLLGLPPLNLFDAAASDLSDCFTSTPDFEGYQVAPEDARLFDPAAAREPLDPQPSVSMDDPAVIREQHRSDGGPPR